MDLYQAILSNEYDILLFAETWLHGGIFDAEVCDSRYDVFRCDRDPVATKKRTGGGVMMCVRRELCAVSRDACVPSFTEILWVTLPTCANLHVGVAYVPPDPQTLPVRVDDIICSVRSVFAERTANVLLVGDFNMPSIAWSSGNPIFLKKGSVEVQDAGVKLLDELSWLGLNQYNNLMNINDNTLDLAFCTLPLGVVRSNPIIKEDVFHPSFCVDVHDLSVSALREAPVVRHNFNKGDYLQINNFLNAVDWGELHKGTLDEGVNHFYDKIYESIDYFIPKRIVRSGSRTYPVWFSRALIKIIREKSNAHRLWKRTLNPSDYDVFKLLRTRQKRVQELCLKEYTSRIEQLLKTTPKIFWTYVKSKRGGSSYPNAFSLADTKFTGGLQICEAFSSYFEGVFCRPASVCSSAAAPTLSSYVPTEYVSHIDFYPETISIMLENLDVSKGAGCDGVSPRYISMCAKSLAYPLSIIFTRSMREGFFPSVWKRANIVPIHKKGSRSNIENYRPISILNIFGKVFEKIVYCNIYPIISRGISDSQHGFLRGRSTLTNLTYFTDFLLNKMEGGGQVDVIYTDFEKAFDRVDHTLLLIKLQQLGIHGDLLRWMESYLRNRSQAVVVGGYKSNYVSIPSGVPQGSHLGPLFYNVYIYDLHNSLKTSNHILYADDKKVFKQIRNLQDCIDLQNDLNSLHSYYLQNRITVNIKKCQCISFSRRKQITQFNYSFNNTAIERVPSVRDLGITLDSKLTFNPHIEMMTNKAYKSLGFVLRTCKSFSNPSSLLTVYFAYVRNVVEYACQVWSPQYIIYKHRIEQIQRTFLRHLDFRLSKSNECYQERCRYYNTLTLEERRTVMDMSLLHDIVHGRLDSPLLVEAIGLQVPSRRAHRTPTPLLHVPSHSTNYAQNSVLSRLPKVYNKLFNDIDLFMHTKLSFKKLVAAKLLD